MAQLTIVADDLTGAADAAAPFALAGYTTYVALDQTNLPEADVLALTTNSRRLAAEDAYAAVQRAVSGLTASRWLFKKIDSTLRGHPAQELAAMMAAGGRGRALIAPAFPAQHRTTLAGRQRVDGISLEETPFARHVFSSDLLEHFPTARLVDLATVWEGPPAVLAQLDDAAAGMWVADAETDDDLRTLVEAAVGAGIDCLCGSGGLARAISSLRPFRASGCPIDGSACSAPVLVVAGSRHPATMSQLEELRQGGTDLVSLEESLNTATERLSEGRSVAIRRGAGPWREGPTTLARRIVEAVEQIVAAAPVGGLVLTGGDTAAAVCGALGAEGIWLRGEVEPGIPLGVLAGGRLAGLGIATKAGGFGGTSALGAMVKALTNGHVTGQ